MNEPIDQKRDARALDRGEYRQVKQQMLTELAKPREIKLPAAEKPVADMDRREYEKHRSATMKALRGRKQ